MTCNAVESRLRARPKLLALVREVAELRFVTVAEVCSRNRSAPVVASRHECWAHMKDRGWSAEATGELWGVDHTTVLAAMRGWQR